MKEKFLLDEYKDLDNDNYVIYFLSNLSQNEKEKYGITDELFNYISGIGVTEFDAKLNLKSTIKHLILILIELDKKLDLNLIKIIKELKEENE